MAGNIASIFVSPGQTSTCDIKTPGLLSYANFDISDAPYGIQRGLIINLREYGSFDSMALIYQIFAEWSGQYIFFRVYNPTSNTWSSYKQISFVN